MKTTWELEHRIRASRDASVLADADFSMPEDLLDRTPRPVELFEADGVRYLVRAYLPGRSLAEAWEPGAEKEPAAAELGAFLCRLLDRLHGLDPPVIHRDIKPENIILSPGGEPCLIDFGIARSYDPDRESDTACMGTRSTAAPEQYGFAQSDQRTDLYALAVTLRWMVTGSYRPEALAQPPKRRAPRILAACLLAALLAAENEDGGPRLVVRWLDWDDQGRCYASEDTLAPESGGADDLGYEPTRGDHVIFFVQDGGKKVPIVPEGDKNISVINVDKENIVSGAKQSAYYVRLEMKEFKDGEITAKYQGKTLTFPVTAELPDVGFYRTPEGLLPDDYDPSQLTDMTAYLVRSVSDDPDQRQVTDVKKNSNGSSNMYDLEKAGDNVWKITLKFEEGGAWVDLDIAFRDADGSRLHRGAGMWLRVS